MLGKGKDQQKHRRLMDHRSNSKQRAMDIVQEHITMIEKDEDEAYDFEVNLPY